jgi:hypothetical protein
VAHTRHFIMDLSRERDQTERTQTHHGRHPNAGAERRPLDAFCLFPRAERHAGIWSRATRKQAGSTRTQFHSPILSTSIRIINMSDFALVPHCAIPLLSDSPGRTPRSFENDKRSECRPPSLDAPYDLQHATIISPECDGSSQFPSYYVHGSTTCLAGRSKRMANSLSERSRVCQRRLCLSPWSWPGNTAIADKKHSRHTDNLFPPGVKLAREGCLAGRADHHRSLRWGEGRHDHSITGETAVDQCL